MEFGRKVYVGNYLLRKITKTFSKKEIKVLRAEQHLKPEVEKNLTRGKLPYIQIRTIGGGWRLEIGKGMTMYEALDELCVARDAEGVWRVPGIEGKNAEAIITNMFVDTTVVGDPEYQADKLQAMVEYIGRRTQLKGEAGSSESTEASEDKTE